MGEFAGGQSYWMGGAQRGGVGLPVLFAGGRGCSGFLRDLPVVYPLSRGSVRWGLPPT